MNDVDLWNRSTNTMEFRDEQKLTQSEKVKNGIFSRKLLFWCRNVILSVFGEAIKGWKGELVWKIISLIPTSLSMKWNVFCFVLCRALLVVSIRRLDVSVLLRILFSYSAEVAWKGFLTAWGELFCFCPAARCCSLIGPPVTIRNMVEGGASHTADRGTTGVLYWPHAAMGAGNIQSGHGTELYSGAVTSVVVIFKSRTGDVFKFCARQSVTLVKQSVINCRTSSRTFSV